MTIDHVLLPPGTDVLPDPPQCPPCPDALDKDRQLLELCRVRCDECRTVGHLFGPTRRWVVVGETAHEPAKIYCSRCATAEPHG